MESGFLGSELGTQSVKSQTPSMKPEPTRTELGASCVESESPSMKQMCNMAIQTLSLVFES